MVDQAALLALEGRHKWARASYGWVYRSDGGVARALWLVALLPGNLGLVLLVLVGHPQCCCNHVGPHEQKVKQWHKLQCHGNNAKAAVSSAVAPCIATRVWDAESTELQIVVDMLPPAISCQSTRALKKVANKLTMQAIRWCSRQSRYQPQESGGAARWWSRRQSTHKRYTNKHIPDLSFLAFTCASTRNQTSTMPDDTPRQHKTIPPTSTRVSNMRCIPRALSVASKSASWKMGSRIAKKITSKMADSSKTKMTETSHANQSGHPALMSACAWSGSKKTNDNTNDTMPKIRVSRNGQSTLTQSYNYVSISDEGELQWYVFTCGWARK